MAREIDLDRRPERRGQWLRWALSGPQSAGKTYTALLMAEQLGNRALVIDTERAGPDTCSSELFAERFPSFVPFPWDPPYNPVDLAETIEKYAARFDVIIVDSASHFWEDEGGTRAIVDAAAAKMQGNSWAGWSEGTPAQKRMVTALQAARCHVVFCMRSKVEWAQLPGKGGKLQPTAVGTAPIQRPGFEYEFALGTFLDQGHTLTVTKSRIDAGGYLLELGDEFPPVRDPETGPALNPDFARQVLGWLGSATEQARQASPETVAAIVARFDEIPAGPKRTELKLRFVDRFGKPERLLSDQEHDAVRWLAAELGDPVEEPAEEPAEEPVEEAPPADPAPAAGGRKTAGKTRAGSRKAGAASTASGAADTAPPAAEASGGPVGLSDEDLQKGRSALTRSLLSVSGGTWAADLEAALTDAGLWPIGGIGSGADLERAADVMFPILTAAKEAGAVQ